MCAHIHRAAKPLLREYFCKYCSISSIRFSACAGITCSRLNADGNFSAVFDE
jgi:hypothetical protein